VRYRVGDRGACADGSASCDCGRALPRLTELEGRTDDVLYTRDGRAVGRMDPVFKSRAPLLEAQIVQEALDRIRVRFVPAPGYTPSDGEAIAARIRDRLGDVDVVLEAVTKIPRTPAGKLRAVVSALGPAERALVRGAPGRPA